MGQTIVPAGYALEAFVPDFSEATTGGPSGTISDGGAPGRLVIALPASGHSDPSDGCFVAYPLRDLRGRRFPDVSEISLGTESRYGWSPMGWAQVTEVSPPTLGNGVRVGVAVVAAPTALDVTSADGHGYGAELDYAATPAVRASLVRSLGWFVSSGAANSQIDKVRVAGDLGNNAVANGHRSSDDRLYDSRYVGNETLITGLNSKDPWWLVVYAYRTGASAGTETAIVDVASMIINNGTGA